MELFATVDDVYVDRETGGFNPFIQLDKRLDLPRAKVVETKRNLRSPSQRIDAYLDLYATGHPCPSWRQVAEVLRWVDLDHQADTVESTYVQGRERYMYCYYVYRGLRNEGGHKV